MRTILLAITTVLTVGVATASAATSRSTGAQLDETATENPQSYEACLALARERGYEPGSTEERSGVFVFIDECMNGEQN